MQSAAKEHFERTAKCLSQLYTHALRDSEQAYTQGEIKIFELVQQFLTENPCQQERATVDFRQLARELASLSQEDGARQQKLLTLRKSRHCGNKKRNQCLGPQLEDEEPIEDLKRLIIPLAIVQQQAYQEQQPI